jgi:cytochrome c oxidase assembly protein subunit 15
MTHFGLALFIIAYCFWLWLELGATRPAASISSGRWAVALVSVAAVQMALGALVAGLDAGRSHIDWPLMGGRLVPDDIWGLDPVWRNLVENGSTAQFLHRLVAYGLLGLSVFTAWKFRGQELGFGLILGLVLVQAMLGIITLTNAAPVGLSLIHQAVGCFVLLATVLLLWRTRRSSPAAEEAAGEARQG